MLEDKQTEAISLFEEVLQLPVIDDSQPERHDALMDLANWSLTPHRNVPRHTLAKRKEFEEHLRKPRKAQTGKRSN